MSTSLTKLKHNDDDADYRDAQFMLELQVREERNSPTNLRN